MPDSKPVEQSPLSEVDLPLEVVMLFIGGMALTIAGGVFFAASFGALPFYENGLLGLLLLVFALQTVTLGKTPFGDAERTTPLLVAGFTIASIGIVTCFVPGLLAPLPRILLFFCFGVGGLVQLMRLKLDGERLEMWRQCGGDVRRLIPACASVYALSALVGLLIWVEPSWPIFVTAALLFLLGMAVLSLAFLLRRVYRRFPEAQQTAETPHPLPFGHVMLLLTGVFMVLLGFLLLPVNLGLLSFSGSAQLGLLLITFAVQTLAAGNTPIGPFPRTVFVMACGFLFAALGIVSCLVPNLLVPALTLLVGLLNIAGGVLPFAKHVVPVLLSGHESETPEHPLLRKLFRTQLALNVLSIMFGMSMLVPGIIPGLVVGVVLAANGGVLLYLLRLLIAVDALVSSAQDTR